MTRPKPHRSWRTLVLPAAAVLAGLWLWIVLGGPRLRAQPAGPPPAGPASRPADRPDARPAPGVPAPVVKVLYVEGTPRWEFRYVKNEMLRERSVRISFLLTSAAPDFTQEGSAPDPAVGFPGPLKRFPETAEQLAGFDVLLLGDVDRRLLTDGQLQIIADFVRKGGGGLGMIAGPRYAPSSYRGTPIAALLPVATEKSEPDAAGAEFPDAFRPALTEAGRASPIFRPWRAREDGGAGKEWTAALYWYCRGVTARPAGDKGADGAGAGATVLATHPLDKTADGSPAPLLVVGRCGKGRALFSAIDDSWRWRTGDGEAGFDEYWLEQLRYLAAGHRAEAPAEPRPR